jgi:hypothetical protein
MTELTNGFSIELPERLYIRLSKEVSKGVSETAANIFKMIYANYYITRGEIANSIGISVTAVQKHINKLRQQYSSCHRTPSPAVAAFLRPFGSKRPEVERPTCGIIKCQLLYRCHNFYLSYMQNFNYKNYGTNYINYKNLFQKT